MSQDVQGCVLLLTAHSRKLLGGSGSPISHCWCLLNKTLWRISAYKSLILTFLWCHFESRPNLQVQDKFLLTLSDEEAAKEMQNLLEVSVSALMPAIAETFHRIAQVSFIVYLVYRLPYLMYLLNLRLIGAVGARIYMKGSVGWGSTSCMVSYSWSPIDLTLTYPTFEKLWVTKWVEHNTRDICKTWRYKTYPSVTLNVRFHLYSRWI